MTFEILPERPGDAGLIEPLLDRTFGFDRAEKTVYRLRVSGLQLPDLCFVAVHGDGGLLASLRFWPVVIDGSPAVLLGPLAVEPALQGQGIGRALVHHGLTRARLAGHRLCLVVGAPEYYRPFGFVPASAQGLVLPGPVDLPRFQVLELATGALEGVRGSVATAASRALDRALADDGESDDGDCLRGPAVA